MNFHCSSQFKKPKKTIHVLIEKESLVCSKREYSISKRLNAGLRYLQIKSFSCRSHPTLIHKPTKVKRVFKSCCNFNKEIVSSTDLGKSRGYLTHTNTCVGLETGSSFISDTCCSSIFKQQILHEETAQQHLNFILQQFTGTVKDVWQKIEPPVATKYFKQCSTDTWTIVLTFTYSLVYTCIGGKWEGQSCNLSADP